MIVVACFGNLLKGDDGFGVEVARVLAEDPPPPGVRLLEVGIGGLHVVQDLLDPSDALILVDAVDLGRPPGTVVVVRPAVRAPTGPDDLAGVHYTTPQRVLALAEALGVLPASVWLVGCQARDGERLGVGLSPPVETGVAAAAGEVRRLVSEAGVAWPTPAQVWRRRRRGAGTGTEPGSGSTS